MKSFNKFIEEMAASVEKDGESSALDKAKSIFAKNREKSAADAQANREKSKTFGGAKFKKIVPKFTRQGDQ